MVRYILDGRYYQNRREIAGEALLLDKMNAENDHLVKQGYSEQQRFIDIRPIAFHYCLKYESTKGDVAYLALTYYDRFLSRNIDIPVLLQGEGFERNLQLFVFACVVIARREEDGESFNFYDFVTLHQVANVSDVMKMESLIWNGLDESVTRPPTAFDFEPLIMDPLNSLLEMEDEEQVPDLLPYVEQIIFAINDDIKFTKFRPSTLTASTILVTCYKLFPVLYPACAKKIFKSGYFQGVRECFEEMKDHVIVDYILNCEGLDREDVRREQGKKILMDEDELPEPFVYYPVFEHPLEFVLEDSENKIDEFRAERQNQEHTDYRTSGRRR